MLFFVDFCKMGCNSSYLVEEVLLDDNYLNSLPSELSIETINLQRNSGRVSNKIDVLKSISTDLSNENPKNLQDERELVFLIVCTTIEPESKDKIVAKVNDSILLAKAAQTYGYQCFALIDPKSTQLLSVLRLLLAKTKKSLTIFFNSFATRLENEQFYRIVWDDQMVKTTVISDSVEAYKNPGSKVKLFFDCDGSADFSAQDMRTLDNTSYFVGRHGTPLSFLMCKALSSEREISSKDLVANVISTSSPYDGYVTYTCQPKEDEDTPLFVVTQEK
jgi:hypothetical protein